MYPHLDTALALSRSEQASLASINKELLQRNAQLRSRVRDLDELVVSRDKALDNSARSSTSTINTLQQSVMLMDQRLVKYQQRIASQEETLSTLEGRLQISERERAQAQSDRTYLTHTLEQLKRTHTEEVLALNSKHQSEMMRLQDELNHEISRLREQWLSEQRLNSQLAAERQTLQTRLANAEADRNADRKALVEALASLEAKRAELAESDREADQAKSRVDALTLTTTQQGAQISALNTRVQSLTKQLTSANDEVATWKADAESHHRSKLDLQTQLAQAQEHIDHLKAELRQQREAIIVAQNGRQDALEQLESERSESARLERKLVNKQAENEALAQRLVDEEHALRLAEKREESLSAQLADTRLQHQDAIDALQAARAAEIDGLREKARASEAALHELRHKLRTAQTELNIAIDTTEAESAAATVAARSQFRSLASPSPRRPISSSSTSSSSSSAVHGPTLGLGHSQYQYRQPAGLSSSFSSLSGVGSSSLAHTIAAVTANGVGPSLPSSSSSSSSSYQPVARSMTYGVVSPPRGAYERGVGGAVAHGAGGQTQITTTTTLAEDAAPVRIDITPLKSRYPRA